MPTPGRFARRGRARLHAVANRATRWGAIAATMALLVVAALASAVAAAPPDPGGPRVRAELIADRDAVTPGEAFWVALRQRIAPGWHTYWINPGDSGEPTSIEWTLPEGFAAGDIAWPHPERIPVGPAMTFGYSNEVVLPMRMTVPAALDAGRLVTLRGRADWLVCEKICIPESTEVALTLPVAAGGPNARAASAPTAGAGAASRQTDPAAIAAALRAVPAPSPWPASFEATAETVTLTVAVANASAERVADVWFYPSRWGVIDLAAAQDVAIDRRGITVRVARGALPDGVSQPIEGVLVVKERLDQGETAQAMAIRAPRAVATSPLRLLSIVGFALAGGLILNLMPCVLPVLAVKALSLLNHGADSPARMRAHGFAYTAGVLASFAAVAGVLLGLRAAGAQIGWGFQLQSPAFVALMAYAMFAVGLSLSGVITIGSRFAGLGHGLAARPGYAGSFFTGALATLVATPCTAPFMGVAVGFALTQPWWMALAVFEALGLGLALPYLSLSLVPAWRRWLPRPGAWMHRLEQLLAFPLYASVAWLVWVVSQQAGPGGVAAVLAGLVLIAFAAWLYEATRDVRVPWRRATAVAAIALVATAVGIGHVVGEVAPPPTAAPGGDGASGGASRASGNRLAWQAFSARRVAELRAEGRPVFVNFTAAWCITCLVNERVALQSDAVAAAFARKGVVPLKADWTNRDAEIARILASFGRSGVPLYVVYPPTTSGQPTGAEPSILPQVLSEGAVVEAIEKL